MKETNIKIRISDEKKEAYKKSVPSMSADLHKHIDRAIKKAKKNE